MQANKSADKLAKDETFATDGTENVKPVYKNVCAKRKQKAEKLTKGIQMRILPYLAYAWLLSTRELCA